MDGQTVKFIYSGVLFIVAVYFLFREKHGGGAILFAAFLLALVAPMNLTKWNATAGKEGISVEVNTDSTERIATTSKDILAIEKNKVTPEIEERIIRVEQTPDAKRSAVDYLILSVESERKGKLVDALTFAREGLRLKPENPISKALLLSNMGAALAGLEDFEAAEAAYRQAIMLNPRDVVAQNNLGLVLEEFKRFGKAKEAYHQATLLDPGYAKAQNNLGAMLEKFKDVGGAENAYRQAIMLDPKFVGAHNNLGVLLASLQNFKEAEASFRQMITIDPESVEAHNNLGALLISLKCFKEAEAYLRQAIVLDSEHVPAYQNLERLRHDLKSIEEAEASFCQAKSLKLSE